MEDFSRERHSASSFLAQHLRHLFTVLFSTHTHFMICSETVFFSVVECVFLSFFFSQTYRDLYAYACKLLLHPHKQYEEENMKEKGKRKIIVINIMEFCLWETLHTF